jgi:hypothetical protein
LLPQATRTQILATAFNRHHRQTNEGGSIEEEFRVEYVADRTNTFATAFLGLTLECVRCHSHKYDPIMQKEYYVGAGSHRRSLYSFWKRTSPSPAMLTFDATTREVCAVKRQTTATPLQALVLLNAPQFVEAARSLAQRALAQGGQHAKDRIRFVFRTLTGRRPKPKELVALDALCRQQYDEFRSCGSDAKKLLHLGDLPFDQSLDPAECTAMTELTQAILNHDETVMNR